MALLTIAACFASAVLAHHSFAAEFDASKAIRLTGTLIKVEWTNPHSYFYIDVKDEAGTVVNGRCEAGSPGALSRRGFKRGDIKLGDTLIVDGYRAKDGSHLVDARRVTLPDGRDRVRRVGRRRGPGRAAGRAESIQEASVKRQSVVLARRGLRLPGRDAGAAADGAGADRRGRQVREVRKPTPRTADGHPDLSGYWKGTRDTTPGGNIGKDLPGFKLPLTPAGEAALQHNLTATIDPESLCIIGGIPRHNASGLPFEVLQGANKVAFLYWYSYFRLIPIDAAAKHSDDPDPSFFGEEVGTLGGRYAGDRLDRLQGREGLDRRERQSPQRRAARRRALDAARPRSHSRRDADRGSEVLHQAVHVRADLGARESRTSRSQEYSCSENNVDRDHLGFGPGPIRPDGTRGYSIWHRCRRRRSRSPRQKSSAWPLRRRTSATWSAPSRAARRHSTRAVAIICVTCGAPLLARYDLAGGRGWSRDTLRDREP